MSRSPDRVPLIAVVLALCFTGCATDMVAPRDQYRVTTIAAPKEAIFDATRVVLFQLGYRVTAIDIYAGIIEAVPMQADSLEGLQRYRFELRERTPDVCDVRVVLRVQQASCDRAAGSVPVPMRYLARLDAMLSSIALQVSEDTSPSR